jgi:hypothetical protein
MSYFVGDLGSTCLYDVGNQRKFLRHTVDPGCENHRELDFGY